MKYFLPSLGVFFLFFSCNRNNDSVDRRAPTVSSESSYEVVVEKDVIYGTGLSHEDWNSENSISQNLIMDIYYPNNQLDNRPMFMFVHGGGFSGGSKEQDQIIDLANYYASRGWVFISINYRLANDFGTVPQDWIDFTVNIPDENDDQFLAMYPAIRDSKSALRWMVQNANQYSINPEFITVGGGSAGAITAIAIGVTNENDFRDEISIDQDPSLSTIQIEQSYHVKTIVDFWGSKVAVDVVSLVDGVERFDVDDPPLFIAHGTDDTTVPFSSAEELKMICEENDIPLAYYPGEGLGHGAWNMTVNGKSLADLVFDFVVDQQDLMVE